MKVSDYMSFLMSQGLYGIKTTNTWWLKKFPGVYVTAPEAYPAQVEATDCHEMFWRHRLPLLRVIESAAKIEKEHERWYRYVCRDNSYDLSSLSQKARNQTRRALERCLVRRIDFEFLGREGVRINQSALARQGRAGSRAFCDPEHWHRSMAVQAQFRDVIAFGAFVEELRNPFCAYLTVMDIEGEWLIYLQMSHDEGLKFYCNNALYYYTLHYLLKEHGAKAVNIGLEPLTPLDTLAHFKINMGFQTEAVRQRLLIHPILRPIINKITMPYSIKLFQLLFSKGKITQHQLEQFLKYSSHLIPG